MESLPPPSESANDDAERLVRDEGGEQVVALPEPASNAQGVLVERIEGRGGHRDSNRRTGASGHREERRAGQGDLLGSFLAPFEPVSLSNVPVVESRQVPGVRRVEVARVDGSEAQGESVGTVPEGRALMYPTGDPQVYGPPVAYPPHMGNPGQNVGTLERQTANQLGGLDPPVQTPYRQSGGMGSFAGNPFWSPEARALFEGPMTDGPIERQRFGNTPGGTTQVIPQGGGQLDGFVTRMDPVNLFRARNATPNPETPEVVMDPVELFRLRCLREAEQKFARGMAQMVGGEPPDVGSNSYVSAISGGPQWKDQNVDQKNLEKPPVVGQGGEPPGLEGYAQRAQFRKGKGIGSEPPNKGIQEGEKKPPGDAGETNLGVGWKRDFVGEVSSETLRTIDLPPLPPDTNPISFGDWLAIVEPLMADISYSSGIWWQKVMTAVRSTYEEWLVESPLGRLKMQVNLPDSALAWPRTEKRAVSMLLQALPEKLKLEMVTYRKMSTHQIMFRLYCLFQPGGQAERSNLLHLLTDFKLGTNVGDHAQSIRQWIRWLDRCEELKLVPPDPMVLSGVLGRVSDALAKVGPQLGFRLSSIRQDLQLDNRPSMDEIKVFADFLLAESEEMALNYSTGQGSSKPSVKSLNTHDAAPKEFGNSNGPLNAAMVTSKTPCRFWLTEEGCRKADKCKFVHSFLDPKENRCFLCSATGHGKRECPYGSKTKVAKTQNGKGNRKPEPNDGKGKKGGSEKGGSGKSDGTPQDPQSSSSGEKVLGTPGSQHGGDAKGNPVVNNELGNLLTEASELMKSLRPSVKMIEKKEVAKKASSEMVATGLLDGGATNALREGSTKEIQNATIVTVELAKGTATLYQDPITGTLYSEEPVEPIVPLRGIVSLGYKIKWDSKGCTILHPTQGKLSCWLRNGCPVVRESHALKLIHEIEEMERERQKKPKLASEHVSDEVRSWWLKRFPQVPASVVDYMVGQDQEVPLGSELPWNRRIRRRVDCAKAVIIHLFSGKGSEWTKGWPSDVEILTLDVRENPRQNLHDPKVWSYLIHVVKTKNVIGIVGGPPCRTVSRLRNIQPGPKPLRGRTENRFGLPSLSEREKQMADSDSALLLKQLCLYEYSEEYKKGGFPRIGFLLESPEDPASYANEFEAASFWAWDEIKEFQKKWELTLASFDQGCLGHVQRKPTSCLTNLESVIGLHGVRCSKPHGCELNPNLGERFEQTSSWSKWAPELCQAIRGSLMKSVLDFLPNNDAVKKALSREQWKTHIIQGHRPYRRDCRACILDMAAGPAHRRREFGGTSAWSLGVDIIQLGGTKDDVTGLDVKYALVGTALVPVFEHYPPSNKIQDDEEKTPFLEEIVEPSWGEGLDEEEFALEIGSPAEVGLVSEQDKSQSHPPKESGIDEDDLFQAEIGVGPKGGSLEVQEGNGKDSLDKEDDPIIREIGQCSAPLKIRHVTLAEPLASRSTGDVTHALTVLLIKMRSLGIHVNRLHGDRAKELLSRNMETWCAKHGLVRTLGGGDDPANNGHVESEINQIKRRVRLLLRSSGQDVSQRPNALRYAVEERMRSQLEKLGVPVMCMIPYASKVLVKRKRWHDAGVLAAPYVEGELLCPSPQMSHGWVVKTVENRILHVREAIVPSSVGEEVALELQESPPKRIEVEEFPPARRVHGKQPPKEVSRIPLPSPETYGNLRSPEHVGSAKDDGDSEYCPTTPRHSDVEGTEEPRVLSLSGGGF